MNHTMPSIRFNIITFLILSVIPLFLRGQSFYFGADLSYVNEMEDCGVVYTESQQPKDPYQVFADHNCQLVRLRLWHTPAWYDALNNGNRYSDLADVKKSIGRAKSAGMKVLLDFHLSDNWADPGNQLVPAAWLDVVDDLPVLKDSLYQYLFTTLMTLNQENLLPDMVQIGNETNKGILLSPDDNATWTLEWSRNATLFNSAIDAVRAVENMTGQQIEIALHVANPGSTEWLIAEFVQQGVVDFDIIGISYYWVWHQPVTLEQTGAIIQDLKNTYPGKKVMILETGYPWTAGFNDNANNINSTAYPGYEPLSPANQQKWLIALTDEVMKNSGNGVVYWEPAWVSSPCFTQWGQGSHQENVAFFDFDNNLLESGGIGWMTYDYTTADRETPNSREIRINVFRHAGILTLTSDRPVPDSNLALVIVTANGSSIFQQKLPGLKAGVEIQVSLPELIPGTYIASLFQDGILLTSEKIFLSGE